jgi:hypothetical protein
VSQDRAWIKVYGTLTFPLGSHPIPIILPDTSKQGVSFGEVAIEF